MPFYFLLIQVDFMDSTEFIMIPHERIGALIGVKGAVKLEIEQRTGTQLAIDSKEGEVEVTGKGDPIKYLEAIKIVKAIARGFSPKHAMRLLDPEIVFELIELGDYIGRNESQMKSKRGRIIGGHGAARDRI